MQILSILFPKIFAPASEPAASVVSQVGQLEFSDLGGYVHTPGFEAASIMLAYVKEQDEAVKANLANLAKAPEIVLLCQTGWIENTEELVAIAKAKHAGVIAKNLKTLDHLFSALANGPVFGIDLSSGKQVNNTANRKAAVLRLASLDCGNSLTEEALIERAFHISNTFPGGSELNKILKGEVTVDKMPNVCNQCLLGTSSAFGDVTRFLAKKYHVANYTTPPSAPFLG